MCLGLGFGDCLFTAAKSPVALHLDTTLISPQKLHPLNSSGPLQPLLFNNRLHAELFHAWYQKTSVLYTARRGMFFCVCDLARFRFVAVVIDATLLSQR